MYKKLVLWVSVPFKNINEISSSHHTWKAPPSPAQGKKVRQRAACTCCKKELHSGELRAVTLRLTPRRSELSASRHFSWVEQSILSIHQLAKRWGECQVPCLPGANQLALGMLGSPRSQAEGRRRRRGAGWLLDSELATLPGPGSCVIRAAAAGDLRTWQRGQPACQIYFGLSGKVTN